MSLSKLETFGSATTARRLKKRLAEKPFNIWSKIKDRTLRDEIPVKVYDVFVYDRDKAKARQVLENHFYRKL